MMRGGGLAHLLGMGIWARRPFWVTKLGQGARLAWESHQRPLRGEPGKPVAVGEGELGVMWLGHSSFLLQIAGQNVLVDPVLAKRLVLLRRQRRAGVKVEDLPEVDVVLLTHAHMDHMNLPTLRKVVAATKAERSRRVWEAAAKRGMRVRLAPAKGPVAVVPRGCEDLVADLGFSEVRVLDWWEFTEIGGLKVTLTPAKHWGARMFSDTHRLFGGYIVAGGGHSVYHSGDTAYFGGFKEIGVRLRPEVALLPIGAYFPDSYRGVHTSPEEALRGFVECGAKLMVPMHFGTFKLGREPMDEPPVRLMAEARRLGVEDRVKILTEGETLAVKAAMPRMEEDATWRVER